MLSGRRRVKLVLRILQRSRFLLVPFVQGFDDCVSVPAAFGNLLALEVKRRDPINILLLPLLLTLVLDVDGLQLEGPLKELHSVSNLIHRIPI